MCKNQVGGLVAKNNKINITKSVLKSIASIGAVWVLLKTLLQKYPLEQIERMTENNPNSISSKAMDYISSGHLTVKLGELNELMNVKKTEIQTFH